MILISFLLTYKVARVEFSLSLHGVVSSNRPKQSHDDLLNKTPRDCTALLLPEFGYDEQSSCLLNPIPTKR